MCLTIAKCFKSWLISRIIRILKKNQAKIQRLNSLLDKFAVRNVYCYFFCCCFRDKVAIATVPTIPKSDDGSGVDLVLVLVSNK